MVKLVEWIDIEQSLPQIVSVSTTPVRASLSRLNLTKRSFISIIPTSAGVTVTVTLGGVGVAAGQGTPLIQNQPFVQSLDANEKGVFQGEIWLTASGNGTVSMQETFEKGGAE